MGTFQSEASLCSALDTSMSPPSFDCHVAVVSPWYGLNCIPQHAQVEALPNMTILEGKTLTQCD